MNGKPRSPRTAFIHESAHLAGHVITVTSWKGGVGKTTLALELAYLYGAVLIDLDPDLGGASRGLGYAHEHHKTAPLLDALERGRAPRTSHRRHIDLVPSHPDLAANQPDALALSGVLVDWATRWHRPVVVDTAPGGWPTTRGAAAAGSVLVAPALLNTAELDGLEAQVTELDGYPLAIVPNMVPPVPPEHGLTRLERIAAAGRVPVTSPVKRQAWLPRRARRGPITATPPAARSVEYVQQVSTVAGEVARHVTP